jgi:rhamnogalacturonan hydrolase
MFSNFLSAFVAPVLVLSSLASAAGTGALVDLSSVGPSTPLSAKSTICNVLNYGGVADNKTDIGPAIKLAFSSCAIKGGATLYIPPGSYSRKQSQNYLTIKQH